MVDGRAMYVKALQWKTGSSQLEYDLETGSDSRFGGPYGKWDPEYLNFDFVNL
jgi:hypothetical protein